MVEMGFLGDFNKGFVSIVGAFCIFAIIGFIVSGLTENCAGFSPDSNDSNFSNGV